MKLTVFVFLIVLLLPLGSNAHDADAYGGLYRSRDAGTTWLPADAGLFINASNAVAIDPTDSNHLLYGTDTGLKRSQNGGRDWHDQAREIIAGPIFCVAFDSTEKRAYAATATALFHNDANGQWRALDVPLEAFPIAQIVSVNGRAYLAGNNGLYIGNASEQGWRGSAKGLPEEPISALLVAQDKPGVTIHAAVAGRIWRSESDGQSWQQVAGNWTDRRIDTLGFDVGDGKKLWAGGASRVFRSIDNGKNWQAHGNPLPDPNIAIRAIAVSENGQVIVLTTHRGLMRSGDGGVTWAKVESALPLHLEPSPLVQDRSDPNIIYAGFSLRPYNEAWRAAKQAAEQRREDEAHKQMSIVAASVIALLLAAGAAVFLRRRLIVNSPRPSGERARVRGKT